MKEKRKLKSERHHWWPETVSVNWADEEGGVNWLLPNGEVRRSVPKNFGVIGNGHHIKLSSHPEEITPWDENYEPEFQQADDDFSYLIAWLDNLKRKSIHSKPLRQRFVPQKATDQEIMRLMQCVVSLAIRSPMTRETAVSLAEHLRGHLPERERNALIGLNLRKSYRNAVGTIGTRGKFVVIYSPDREFIFGDGFYHTLRAPVESLLAPKLLVPITPRLAVLFASPVAYTIEPRLSTLVIDVEEAELINQSVQIYSRRAIFYRSDRPTVMDAYRRELHLEYSSPDNPIERLIHSIPGVSPRGTSLDFLFDRAVQQNSERP